MRRYTRDVDHIEWNVTIQVAGLDQNTRRNWTNSKRMRTLSIAFHQYCCFVNRRRAAGLCNNISWKPLLFSSCIKPCIMTLHISALFFLFFFFFSDCAPKNVTVMLDHNPFHKGWNKKTRDQVVVYRVGYISVLE